MDSTAFNQAFDASVRATRSFTAEQLVQLEQAYDYGAVTSMQWLRAKLALARDIVQGGQSFTVFEPNGVHFIQEEHQLAAWIGRHFPEL